MSALGLRADFLSAVSQLQQPSGWRSSRCMQPAQGQADAFKWALLLCMGAVGAEPLFLAKPKHGLGPARYSSTGLRILRAAVQMASGPARGMNLTRS